MPRPATPQVWYRHDNHLAPPVVEEFERLWATEPPWKWLRRQSPAAHAAIHISVFLIAGIVSWYAAPCALLLSLALCYGPGMIHQWRINSIMAKLRNRAGVGNVLIEGDASWMVLAHALEAKGFDLKSLALSHHPRADGYIEHYAEETIGPRGSLDNPKRYRDDPDDLRRLKNRAEIAASHIAKDLGQTGM